MYVIDCSSVSVIDFPPSSESTHGPNSISQVIIMFSLLFVYPILLLKKWRPKINYAGVAKHNTQVHIVHVMTPPLKIHLGKKHTRSAEYRQQ